MELEKNKNLVRQYFENLAAADVDAMCAMMSEDVSFWFSSGLGGEQDSFMQSSAKVHRFLSKLLVKVYDMTVGLTVNSYRMTAEEDRVIAEVSIKGRSLVTQLDYHNHYVFIFRLSDGKFSEIKEHLDTAYANRVLAGL